MTTPIRSVAYLGPAGTFAESAVMSLPSVAGAVQEPAGSVIGALDRVRDGSVDAAVVPIENSIEGSVSGTLDELSAAPPLRITAEVAVPVRFTLMAQRPMALADITAVGTHPHASAQCRRWLHEQMPQARVVATDSTAGAAEGLAQGTAEFQAAIGNHLAASESDWWHWSATSRTTVKRSPGSSRWNAQGGCPPRPERTRRACCCS